MKLNELRRMKVLAGIQDTSIELNNIDISSIELDGVDSQDYPDFSDTFVSYALWKNGQELTEEELIALTDQHGELINQLAHESFQ